MTIQRTDKLKTLLQQQPINQILQGDALSTLKILESEYVDCIITSPPYWALRDYKVEGQLGNEKTIQEYVTNLTAVFTEAKRVLKKTGTCWVVLGDTYAQKTIRIRKANCNTSRAPGDFYNNQIIQTLPDKSLCLIPERFAIAMVDAGWILRNKIIWYKKNCMPSSAKDRFTVDYEYIYFFTKSQKYYFKTQYESLTHSIVIPKGFKTPIPYPNNQQQQGFIRNPKKPMYSANGQRIKRCVWQINTQPFPEAHFAVFPDKLVEQCLNAGCPTSDGIVLDPFMGSGTTALVALKHNRKFIGIELNPSYIEMANKRIEPYLLQSKLL